MKVFLVEDEEEQQPKEVVMKSVEQVDKDGHVIHHMDDRGNYLDKEGNVPLEMAPYPIPIRLPLSLSSMFFYPCQWRDQTKPKPTGILPHTTSFSLPPSALCGHRPHSIKHKRDTNSHARCFGA